MLIKRISLQFVVLIVVTLIVSQRAHADALRVFEEKVGPVPEFVIPLSAGETVSFETRNLSPDMDPVLHLWDPTNRVEVGMDDNSGGGKTLICSFACKLKRNTYQPSTRTSRLNSTPFLKMSVVPDDSRLRGLTIRR